MAGEAIDLIRAIPELSDDLQVFFDRVTMAGAVLLVRAETVKPTPDPLIVADLLQQLFKLFGHLAVVSSRLYFCFKDLPDEEFEATTKKWGQLSLLEQLHFADLADLEPARAMEILDELCKKHGVVDACDTSV